MTSKINTGKFSYQYGYDLRNRLASANIARKEGLQDVTITSSYAYNTAGIRTRAEQTINGITQNRYFLLDSGHTGYSQVFEETSTLGGNLVRSYVLGDDVLSQNVGGVNSHLLYDGHGSTRQLAGDDGAVSANYAYDAYGKMPGGNPNVTDKQSATDLLYAGEQFDPGLQMEYLRARYYDQNTGRFNRLDPFEGNSEDPQSLHKYAYAHCDPVNGIDPTGRMLITILCSMSIQNSIASMKNEADLSTFSGVQAAATGIQVGLTGNQIFISYMVGVLLPAGIGGSIRIAASVGKKTFAKISLNFSTKIHKAVISESVERYQARGFITGAYKELSKIKKLKGFQRHHLIEKRFGARLGLTSEQLDMMPAVILDNATHLKITQGLRKEIGYRGSGAKFITDTASRTQILEAHRKVYEENGMNILFDIVNTYLLKQGK